MRKADNFYSVVIWEGSLSAYSIMRTVNNALKRRMVGKVSNVERDTEMA